MDPERKSLRVEIKDAEKGIVRAAFATLESKDKDNDYTLPGAFGKQQVLVSSYGHGSWMGKLPVGKGTISEKDGEAVADLQFFMSTQHGREHFEVVKETGDLQEWSYGFDVKKTGEITEDLREKGVVRVLEKLKVHEVSPVLKGAGDTRTLAVKCDSCEAKDGEQKGTQLGNLLTELRNERELTNDELGSAMGIDASTVGQILNGSINCPPLSRLEGAASALGTSFGRLRSAAERDGCDYGEQDEMRSRAAAADDAAKAATRAKELWESAKAEAEAAIEAKSAAEAKEAIERAEAFQDEAKGEFDRFSRNMERYV